jgi:hypothetical protein
MACTRGRRQPFACGHKGFGRICRRCWQADRLLEKAEALKDKKDQAQAQTLHAEAARLRAVPKKIGAPAVVTG